MRFLLLMATSMALLVLSSHAFAAMNTGTSFECDADFGGCTCEGTSPDSADCKAMARNCSGKIICGKDAFGNPSGLCGCDLKAKTATPEGRLPKVQRGVIAEPNRLMKN